MQRGTLVVAAAGNQGSVGSTAITRHPWVIPVVACDVHRRPLGQSNLGHSIGRNGLMLPGEGVPSLSPMGGPVTSRGTSIAAPLLSGAIALLWSEFPAASAAEIKLAISGGHAAQRTSVVPPLFDSMAAYQRLAVVTSQGV
jgi:subtilisin family serine protease